MSATITIPRELLEDFIVEVDALAIFDSIRNGRNETYLEQHIYGVTEQLERAALGSMSEEHANELHDRARVRAEEIGREWFGHLFEREAAGAR